MSSIAGSRQFARQEPATGTNQARPIQRLFLPLLVMTALLSQFFASSGNVTVAWVSALTFAAFVLALQGPAWALVPILINELTLYSFVNPTFGVGQRFVVVGVAAVIAMSALAQGRLLGDRRMRRVLLPGIAFIVVVTAINLQHSEDTFVFEYLRFQGAQLLVLLIAASVIRHTREVKQIATAVMVITTAIAVIVIWQHYLPDSAIYGLRDDTQKGRAAGLSGGPVSLASQLIFVVAPLLGVLFAIPFRRERKYLLLIGSTLMIVVALNFTYTRSAVFAFAPALIAMAILIGGRQRTVLFGIAITAIVLFFALENTGLIGYRYYRDAEDDRSASSHEVLQDISLAIALDYPLTGIGHEAFTTVSLDYIDEVDEEAFAVGGVSAVGEHQPHNDFLNVWLSWGIVALIAFTALFIGTLRNLVIGARNSDPFIRGLAIGCVGGVVMYGVNSFYHNSLDSSVFLWLYAGISVALARLATAGHPVPNQSPTMTASLQVQQ